MSFGEFKGLRPMPPTPSASGVCMGAGCKAAGCKAAGLQAAGLRAAGVKAARVALQAAGLQCRLQGLRYRLQGGPGQFAQRGGNAVLLHFEVQNSSHLSRASPSKEQNPDTLAKSTPKSGPSVVNSTRIACFWGDWVVVLGLEGLALKMCVSLRKYKKSKVRAHIAYQSSRG